MTETALNKMARICGIDDSYRDYRNDHRDIAPETLRKILDVMGYDFGNEADAEEALRLAQREPWARTLPPVTVTRSGGGVTVNLGSRDDTGGVVCRIVTEAGDEQPVDMTQAEFREAGPNDGERVRQCHIPLPEGLPHGYHRLIVTTESGVNANTRLIVVPDKAYQPDAIRSGERAWGPTVQLYSVRSRSNWGVGDFGDLRRLVQFAASRGANLVGVNPLHALFPAHPEKFSPYSPSHRYFLNVLYIDVPRVPGYGDDSETRGIVESADFRDRLEAARAATHVDYPAVAALKLPVLRCLHRWFTSNHLANDTPEALSYREYVTEAGEALRLHCLHDALDTHFRRDDPHNAGWPAWPEEYRNPDADAIAEFAESNAGEIDFYRFLQWQAHEQLRDVQAAAVRDGMSLGLYADLAVGCDSNGSETWANQALYRRNVSIGAPPDPLALGGQDWGLPPMDPRVLRQNEYAVMIDLLRSNMEWAGALRIDHVMALLRQWWIPPGDGSVMGTYVRYPLDDLMGIVALESLRNNCLVIGEDLGVVPEEIRVSMRDHEVFSYRVFIFEKEHDGSMIRPEGYPENALVTVSTHDLPTLASFWEVSDIPLRDGLGLIPGEELKAEAYAGRNRDKHAILGALTACGLLPDDRNADEETAQPLTAELNEAIHAYIARSRAKILVTQVEDWLFMRDPVNVPGTSDQYPNWRRKLIADLEDVITDDMTTRLCQSIDRGRSLYGD